MKKTTDLPAELRQAGNTENMEKHSMERLRLIKELVKQDTSCRFCLNNDIISENISL